MKKLIIIAMLIVVPFSANARMRLYSRAKREKQIADSLKVIDSLRVVDSIHIADSSMLARYKVADKIRVEEKKLKAEKKRQEAAKTMKRQTEQMKQIILITEQDSTPATTSNKDDTRSERTVVINPDNPYRAEIDSMQIQYDRLNNVIHDNDDRFREMKTFSISEKKRYIVYLLKNKMKDSSAITAYCTSLFNLYTIKHELLLAIQKSQDGNTKGFIQLHIEIHKEKMAELGDFLLVLTPDVPFYPERTALETYSKH